jgi:hypothetical protein
MEIRYYLDPESGDPHIYSHGVSEIEIEQVMHGAGEDVTAKQGARMKLGQTATGRYLQVIYVPDEDGDSVFVITAYELHGKAKTAFRRRRRRKPR